MLWPILVFLMQGSVIIVSALWIPLIIFILLKPRWDQTNSKLPKTAALSKAVFGDHLYSSYSLAVSLKKPLHLRPPGGSITVFSTLFNKAVLLSHAFTLDPYNPMVLYPTGPLLLLKYYRSFYKIFSWHFPRVFIIWYWHFFVCWDLPVPGTLNQSESSDPIGGCLSGVLLHS